MVPNEGHDELAQLAVEMESGNVIGVYEEHIRNKDGSNCPEVPWTPDQWIQAVEDAAAAPNGGHEGVDVDEVALAAADCTRKTSSMPRILKSPVW